MISSGTGRFAPPKIEVTCRCGKRYRVETSKAGKKLRCKKCRSTVVVPGGDDKISLRSRKAILEEFGIDADAAEQRYQAEKEGKGYACSVCKQEIPEQALKASYGEGGLTCAPCRRKKRAEEEQEREEAKLERWTRGKSPEAARRKALLLGGLFALGTAGLVHTFFGPAAWITGTVACVVAAAGGYQVYRGELS